MIYETFSEFAQDFVDGWSLSHQLSDHSKEECIGWQKGVQEFAKWLDDAGGKLLCEPGITEKLWEASNTPQTATQEHPAKPITSADDEGVKNDS